MPLKPTLHTTSTRSSAWGFLQHDFMEQAGSSGKCTTGESTPARGSSFLAFHTSKLRRTLCWCPEVPSGTDLHLSMLSCIYTLDWLFPFPVSPLLCHASVSWDHFLDKATCLCILLLGSASRGNPPDTTKYMRSHEGIYKTGGSNLVLTHGEPDFPEPVTFLSRDLKDE